MHPIEIISIRYPQLCFNIAFATKDTEEYKNAVRRGKRDGLWPRGFSLSPKDQLTTVETPVGTVDVLYLYKRPDFGRCVQALAYRCEPRSIPPSMGAITVSSLINWEKIDRHKEQYLCFGGTNWSGEFKRFTTTSTNYRDSLIIVSNGYYSAVPPEAAGFSEAEWLEKSLTIRTYHELTHFIFRRLFPGDVSAIRDEVVADAVGIIAATRSYDPRLAKLFLGIEGEQYRSGGRLENYTDRSTSPQETVAIVMALGDRMESLLGNRSFDDPFDSAKIITEKWMFFS